MSRLITRLLAGFLTASFICCWTSGLSAQFESLSPSYYAKSWSPVKTVTPRYCVFEPPFEVVQASKKRIPIVVYLHGHTGNDEKNYDRLLKNIALQGYVVLFPYFDGKSEDNTDYTSAYTDAFWNMYSGLTDLEDGRVGYIRYVFPQCRPTMYKWSIMGHSAGGMYALKAADGMSRVAQWSNEVVPPRSIILHDAGGFSSMFPKLKPSYAADTWLDDLSAIPADTELLLIAAENTWANMFKPSYTGMWWGNSLMGGVWSRAWYNTKVDDARKHIFLARGGHYEVQNKNALGVYVDREWYSHYFELTMAGLESGFRSSPLPASSWNELEDFAELDLAPFMDNINFYFYLFHPAPWSELSDSPEIQRTEISYLGIP